MKQIKKIIKVLAFICLIILAGIGIGISGGVPVPLSKSKRNSEKENTELMEEDQSSDSQESTIKG